MNSITQHCQYKVANVEHTILFKDEDFQSIKDHALIQQPLSRFMIVNWQIVSMKPKTLLIYLSDAHAQGFVAS